MTATIECQQVWQEISNYIDGELDADLRSRIKHHLAVCHPCQVVLEGAHNVIRLVGDERCFQVPVGFCQRLYHRAKNEIADEPKAVKPRRKATRVRKSSH